jgi:hypothetical protein
VAVSEACIKVGCIRINDGRTTLFDGGLAIWRIVLLDDSFDDDSLGDSLMIRRRWILDSLLVDLLVLAYVSCWCLIPIRWCWLFPAGAGIFPAAAGSAGAGIGAGKMLDRRGRWCRIGWGWIGWILLGRIIAGAAQRIAGAGFPLDLLTGWGRWCWICRWSKG